ncbi:MAG: diguanylate cyclase [Gallionella sp.]
MLLHHLPPKFAAPAAASLAFIAMLALGTVQALGIVQGLLTGALAYMLVRHLQHKADAEQRLSASQAQLKQRTAELTHQNAVLEMITHNAELPDILEMLALLVEVHHPDLLCSILLLDQDGQHLRHGAAPNLPEFYNKAVDGLSIGQGVCCCGTAAFTGELVVVEDILIHPHWKNYRALAQQANLRSCWSQPIKDSSERIVGTFAIYQHHTATPQATEVLLIEHYAALAALAIERTHSAEALRLHDAALNFAANAILITDLQAHIVWANHAFSELTGYEFEELIGKQLSKLLNSGHQDSAFYTELWSTILSGKSWHGELINRRKDGSLYHDETSITPVRNRHQQITHFVAVKQDISARKEQEEHLKNLAFYDALTQLPNRRLLLDRLVQTLASCTRSGRHGALMFLDLDNFKPLNDKYGHDIGDLLLTEAAQRLTACIRKEDTVSRFGGDEFVVLLKDMDCDHVSAIAQATGVAEKIRTILAEPYRLHLLQSRGDIDEIEHHCTSSIGIALFNGLDASADDILKQADVAMYRAKTAGRNRIGFQPREQEEALNGCEAG